MPSYSIPSYSTSGYSMPSYSTSGYSMPSYSTSGYSIALVIQCIWLFIALVINWPNYSMPSY